MSRETHKPIVRISKYGQIWADSKISCSKLPVAHTGNAAPGRRDSNIMTVGDLLSSLAQSEVSKV